MFITDNNDYSGIGIYLLKDEYGKVYIGSSIDVKRKIKQHNYCAKKGKEHKKLQEAYDNGIRMECEILEKIDYGNNMFYVRDREKYYISKYDAYNGYNVHKTPAESLEDQIMVLKNYKGNPVMEEYITNIIYKNSKPIYK